MGSTRGMVVQVFAVSWMVATFALATGCAGVAQTQIAKADSARPVAESDTEDDAKAAGPSEAATAESEHQNQWGLRFDVSHGIAGGRALYIPRGERGMQGRGAISWEVSVRRRACPLGSLWFGGGLRYDADLRSDVQALDDGRGMRLVFGVAKARLELANGWDLDSSLGVGIGKESYLSFAGLARVSAVRGWFAADLESRLLVFKEGVPVESDEGGFEPSVIAGISLRGRPALYVIAFEAAIWLVNEMFDPSLDWGNCPFVYLVDAETGAYRQHGEIIRNLVGKTMEAEDRLALPASAVRDGVLRLELREEKDEVSYIDALVVLVDGVTNLPRRTAKTDALAVRDGRYLVMYRGDVVPVVFDLADVRPNSAIELVSVGYYEKGQGHHPRRRPTSAICD